MKYRCPIFASRLKIRQPSPSPSFTVLGTLERRVQELLSMSNGDRAGAAGREVGEWLLQLLAHGLDAVRLEIVTHNRP